MQKIIYLSLLFHLISYSSASLAKPLDCVQNGGNAQCTPPIPSKWTYSVCAAGLHGPIVWCTVSGGTTNIHGTCIGATPNTDKNLYERTQNFFNSYGSAKPFILRDSGWGQNFTNSGCWDGKPTYINDQLVTDFRRITAVSSSGENSNSFRKDRKLTCNSTQRSFNNGFLGCDAPPPRGCSADAVGNPCSVTTGNKYQLESDWTDHRGILNFKRTYNSFSLQEMENDFGFGVAWNHNYSQRLFLWEYDDDSDKVSVLNQKSFSIKNWGTLVRPDGKEIHISRNYTDNTLAGDQGWFISRDENLKLIQQADGIWRVEQIKTGIKEYYDQTGSLIKITYPNGHFITLNYENIQLDSTTLRLGTLTKVTDHLGRNLQFHYNPQGLISGLILPNGKQITYQYDAQTRLISVTRPGYGTKTYHYSENSTVAPSGNPNLLTGITDEVGRRYANYAYDAQDRGILTEHAGGAQKYTLKHEINYTLVTDPYGTQQQYNKSLLAGTVRVVDHRRAGVVQNNHQYDQAGNITRRIEKGLTTTYSYDHSRNLEISRTEAVGTAQERTIETAWHTDFSKPVQIKESASGVVVKITDYTYDDRSNVISKTITDPVTQQSRTWHYDYNLHSQLTKETNPLGQTTTYTYDPNHGHLLIQTDFTGAVTTFSQHTLDGLPQVITHPTGMVVRSSYDDAGRIIQQKQESNGTQLTIQAPSSSSQLSWWQTLLNELFQALGLSAPYPEPKPTNNAAQATIAVTNTIQTAITAYEYDPRGLLISTTLPDGERIEYSYDDAHRLVEIKDQSGNRTVYTLNANGDITQTEVYGTSGQLEAKNQQIYDNLGRLQATLGNAQQQQNYSYNQKDELINEKNALNAQNSYGYDALGRKITETDSLNGVSRYEYDAFDQLKKVIDANNGTTTSQYNAFGEKVAQQSPDTGATSYQYHNGQLLEKVDANQRKHQYQYDAQGRVILQKDQYTDGSDRYEQTSFAYGTTGNNLGKLTSANNKRAETQLSYNSLGLVAEKSVKYLATHKTTAPQLKNHYVYSAGGKLKQIGLASGNIVNYDYNATGQLTGIRFNDQSFINNIQYSANGVKAWTYSQAGDTVQMQYDLDGRISKIQMPNVYDKNYSYDAADRILTINDSQQSSFNSAFKHDALNRLIEQNTLNQTLKYSYDKNSNRLSRQTIQGTNITTESYTLAPDSNRLTTIQQGTVTKSYQYLPTGQITADGIRNYSYDAQGRSETISQGNQSVFNAYDAFGQRIQKFSTVAGTTIQTLFMYDENGQLLGEYTPEGQVIREYIWLGNTLVGLKSSQYPNEILRMHTDHLGTPRAISNNNNEVVWRWEGDQFGDVLPTGNLTFPIRHAGQYYDAEVNIFYNYFRDYDPVTGRYVESDPIGLDGGLNTYGYVNGNPLRLIDPRGLDSCSPFLNLGFFEIQKCNRTPPPNARPMVPAVPIPNNPPKDEQCDKDSCPPCTPYPVGTIGYQGPKTSTRGIHGTRAGTGEEHYILFEVQQNPQTCQCRWQENKKVAGHHYMWQPNLFMTINLNGKGRPPSYP